MIEPGVVVVIVLLLVLLIIAILVCAIEYNIDLRSQKTKYEFLASLPNVPINTA